MLHDFQPVIVPVVSGHYAGNGYILLLKVEYRQSGLRVPVYLPVSGSVRRLRQAEYLH